MGMVVPQDTPTGGVLRNTEGGCCFPVDFSHSFSSPGAGIGEMLPLHGTGLVPLAGRAPGCASNESGGSASHKTPFSFFSHCTAGDQAGEG